MLNRRKVLAAAPASVALAKTSSAEVASPLPELELSTPEEHVRAFIKILASLEDATIFHMYKGTLEALIPGRAPVKLVDTTTVIRRQVDVLPEGHKISIWEATVYHRPGDTVPLESFENPLNGRIVRPFHQREGRGESLWTSEGSRFRRADGTWGASNSGKPFTLEWTQAGDRIWTSRYRSGVYLKHPLDPDTWPLEFAGEDLLYSEKTTSSGFVREMADPSVKSASATYSLSQGMIWWPWLLMGQSPGYLLWNTNGVKLSDPNMIAAADRKLIEKAHPTILEAGEPWEGHVNLWTDYPKMREPVPV